MGFSDFRVFLRVRGNWKHTKIQNQLKKHDRISKLGLYSHLFPVIKLFCLIMDEASIKAYGAREQAEEKEDQSLQSANRRGARVALNRIKIAIQLSPH